MEERRGKDPSSLSFATFHISWEGAASFVPLIIVRRCDSLPSPFTYTTGGPP